MEFGLSISLNNDCIDFLHHALELDIKTVKIYVPFNVKRKAIQDVCSFLYKNKMKAYFVLISLTRTPLFKDPMYAYLTYKKEELYDRYQKVLGYLKPKTAVLGVGLVENIELAIRTGNKNHEGISRKEVVKIQQQLSTMVVDFKTVMKCRINDILSGHWKEVDCDVYDFSGVVDRNFRGDFFNNNIKKECWLSRTTMYGGFNIPVQRARFLEELKLKANRYPFIFLNINEDWRVK